MFVRKNSESEKHFGMPDICNEFETRIIRRYDIQYIGAKIIIVSLHECCFLYLIISHLFLTSC